MLRKSKLIFKNNHPCAQQKRNGAQWTVKKENVLMSNIIYTSNKKGSKKAHINLSNKTQQIKMLFWSWKEIPSRFAKLGELFQKSNCCYYFNKSLVRKLFSCREFRKEQGLLDCLCKDGQMAKCEGSPTCARIREQKTLLWKNETGATWIQSGVLPRPCKS